MARFLKVGAVYRGYVCDFFRKHPDVATAPYADQKQALIDDCTTPLSAYSQALSRLGYETSDVVHNAAPLQLQWAREHGWTRTDLREITVQQAKEFRPEILWFDSPDGDLIQQIRAEVPSIRLAIGWEGSALSVGTTWRHLDLVLSCAPESVDRLRSLGLSCEHLNHGFNPAVSTKLRPPVQAIAISFIGSLIRRNQYHVERDHLLMKVCEQVPLQIFTPDVTWHEYYKMLVGGVLYAGLSAAEALRIRRRDSWPHFIKRSASPFRRPINPALRTLCHPPVFGLSYFQTVRDSRVSLNIHADSSPLYASNMRLFEVTGVGSCLLTDAKRNLPSLFAPDREVVTYRSADECAEKSIWLLNHTAECSRIAEQGRERTLNEHTVDHRARELDQLIQRVM